jgi:hypothetical protein
MKVHLFLDFKGFLRIIKLNFRFLQKRPLSMNRKYALKSLIQTSGRFFNLPDVELK